MHLMAERAQLLSKSGWKAAVRLIVADERPTHESR
jgi:hypothetical protein